MTTVQDRIERSITIKAPIERVFAAISQPEHVGKWFCEKRPDGDFTPGGQPLLDMGEYGRFRLSIVANDPPTYFAWRWVSGSAFVPQGFETNPLDHPNTLVEFRLESIEDGTLVKLTESGFASLPDAYAEQNLNDNTDGWAYMLNRLDNYARTGSAE